MGAGWTRERERDPPPRDVVDDDDDDDESLVAASGRLVDTIDVEREYRFTARVLCCRPCGQQVVRVEPGEHVPTVVVVQRADDEHRTQVMARCPRCRQRYVPQTVSGHWRLDRLGTLRPLRLEDPVPPSPPPPPPPSREATPPGVPSDALPTHDGAAAT